MMAIQRNISHLLTAALWVYAPLAFAQQTASKIDPAHSAGTTVSSSPDTPDPAPALPPQPSSQFILGASDVIRVSVWKNNDLSQTVTVGPDGFVSLPLLGDVHVAGMTASELGKVMSVKLKPFMVNPQVTVSVIDIRSRQVYVLGQVGKPGGYPLIAPITILQLIAEAGGLNTYANRKNIFVLRVADKQTTKISFNYSDVIHGNGKQNIDLQPGDTVVVP